MQNRTRADEGDGDRSGQRRYLSYADLETRYGKTRMTIYRWVRLGLLPAPYETGPHSVGFDSREIDERDANLRRRAYLEETAA